MRLYDIHRQVKYLRYQAFSHIPKDVPFYFLGSEHFTTERMAKSYGLKVHGNDVSLYSCALGYYLTGRELEVTIKDSEFNWLQKYLDIGGATKVCAIYLAKDMLDSYGSSLPVHQRLLKKYTQDFEVLLKRTEERFRSLYRGFFLDSFTMDDMERHLASIPYDSFVMCGAPTYVGGYEKITKNLDAVFSFDKPVYPLIDHARLKNIMKLMSEKRFFWVELSLWKDDEVPDYIKAHYKHFVKTTARNEPERIYSNVPDPPRILSYTAHHEDCKLDILASKDELTGRLEVLPIHTKQFDVLRDTYLAKYIAPGKSSSAIGYFDNGRLFGASTILLSSMQVASIVSLSAFTIPSDRYSLLSKLRLAMLLTKEFQELVTDRYKTKVKSIITAAFAPPGSEKDYSFALSYEGLFRKFNVDHKKGMVSYVAKAGIWTLEEAFAWWKEKQEKQKDKPRPYLRFDQKTKTFR